jgi:hypothetical protein
LNPDSPGRNSKLGYLRKLPSLKSSKIAFVGTLKVAYEAVSSANRRSKTQGGFMRITEQEKGELLDLLNRLSPEGRERVLKKCEVLFRRLMMKANVIVGGKKQAHREGS